MSNVRVRNIAGYSFVGGGALGTLKVGRTYRIPAADARKLVGLGLVEVVAEEEKPKEKKKKVYKR